MFHVWWYRHVLVSWRSDHFYFGNVLDLYKCLCCILSLDWRCLGHLPLDSFPGECDMDGHLDASVGGSFIGKSECWRAVGPHIKIRILVGKGAGFYQEFPVTCHCLLIRKSLIAVLQVLISKCPIKLSATHKCSKAQWEYLYEGLCVGCPSILSYSKFYDCIKLSHFGDPHSWKALYQNGLCFLWDEGAITSLLVHGTT